MVLLGTWSVKNLKYLDDVLELFSNGEWHNLIETADTLGVNGVKMGILAAFLNYYGFIELKGLKAKLTEPVYQFLKKIKWIERAEKK